MSITELEAFKEKQILWNQKQAEWNELQVGFNKLQIKHNRVCLIGIILIVLLLSARAFAAEPGLSLKEQTDLVNFHNKIRKEAGVSTQVSWSPELAKFAQEWADEIARTGEFKHRPRDADSKFVQKYGENIAYGSGPKANVMSRAQDWYSEIKLWDKLAIPADTSTFKAGHYTQMIWSGTSQIGAGKAVIKTGPLKGSLILVCNYDPAGNMRGENPIK